MTNWKLNLIKAIDSHKKDNLQHGGDKLARPQKEHICDFCEKKMLKGEGEGVNRVYARSAESEDFMKYIQGTVRIETKFSDEAKGKAAQTVCDWADKHEMYTNFGFSEKGDYLCEYQAKGRTTAYCRGMASEIKDLIKASFNAKVTTMFEAY